MENVEHSVLNLVQSSGVPLNQEGKLWTGTCPFHDDGNNSLCVEPETNHWQCDGPCQTGGGPVEWFMKAKGVSRTHAMALVKSEYPVSISIDGPAQRTTVRELDAPFETGDDDQTVLQRVLSFYQQTLKISTEALEYLKSRCIDNPEAIEHFMLGFSNRTLGYHLPAKNRKEGAALRGHLQRLGIIRSNGHEHFRGSIVVPIINDDVVHQVYGRKIATKLRPGTPEHCTLPGPMSAIFNLDAVRISDEIILCQSVIDALTFWCAGYRNVTCIFGLQSDTAEILFAFEQYGTKRVSIAFAATQDGDVAAFRLAEALTQAGIDAYRIELPRSFDINEYVVNTGSPHESLGKLIRKAAWMGQGQPKPIKSGEHSDEVVADAAPDEIPSDTNSTQETEPDCEVMLPATVVPEPPSEIEAEVNDNEVVICLEDRRYRIRALDKNLSYDTLKLNILVSRESSLHVDTFDLYSAKHRSAFIRLAASELGVKEDVVKNDLSMVLLKLEVLQHQTIQGFLEPMVKEKVLSKKERDEAMSLLQSHRLMERLLEDYERCGVIGEKTNKLIGYLAALSRKLDNPLAIIIQSTSAAGKSALMDAVLSFVPEEDRVQYSAMTGQSLFYMGDVNLQHKILAINEEEGASKATYALKLLQSEGQLTIASTGKDPNSGRHVTHEYRVQGPVMIFSTTTAIDIDEELLNRCLVLTVDEEREQTKAIHDYQRFEETLEGLLARQARNDIIRVHRNAQRLLKSFKVVNPYAEQLTFLSDKTRTRRDHKKYLTLIRVIALLHQYQREIKSTYLNGKPLQYIEATLEDIDLANQLAHEVLGHSLDGIPPQTRRLLMLIDDMVSEQCLETAVSRSDYLFGRREIREYTGWGDTQLKVHLKRLEAMEYLLIHRGGRGRQIVYELLYNSEGLDGNPFLMGLIDVDTLKNDECEENMSGDDDLLSDLGRVPVGVLSRASQTPINGSNHCGHR